MTPNELSLLSNQALADYLLDLHSGPSSATYKVASIMFSGHDPVLADVQMAIGELAARSPEFARELSERYESKLLDWVKLNCKGFEKIKHAPEKNK